MTQFDLPALMPLIILTAGCVLCLLAGAVRPGSYLYGAAIGCIAAAIIWTVAVPVDAVMPGLTVTPFSRATSVFLYGCGIIGLLLALSYNQRRRITGEEYPATLLFALVGMGATCASSNLLMLFLGLESFTFAFYILVAIERDSTAGGEAGLKYLLNGTLSAAVMGMGMALLYAARGTLKLDELAGQTGTPEPLFMAGCCLLLLGLAFKLSLVPAHLWTPDVYQGAPAPVTALLSTASKTASLAALLLVFPLLSGWNGYHGLLWLTVLCSLLCGNLAALRQVSIKRMLAWSSIAQMGYVVLGCVAARAGGLQAAAFYVAAYAAAGLAAFGAVAVLPDAGERDRIEDYRGLGYTHPLASATLATAMFSLAGIPPTAGFMAKFAVFSAALRGGEVVLAIAGALTALAAAFFYLRVVVTLYMKPPETGESASRPLCLSEMIALMIPLAVTIALGLYPSMLLNLLERIIRS